MEQLLKNIVENPPVLKDLPLRRKRKSSKSSISLHSTVRSSTTLLPSTQPRHHTSQRSKAISAENRRLCLSLMAISQRKFRSSPEKVKSYQRAPKIHSPHKQKEVIQANQRLGKALVRIHSGKTVERVRTQIAQAAEKRLKAEQNKRSKRLNMRLGLEQGSILFPAHLRTIPSEPTQSRLSQSDSSYVLPSRLLRGMNGLASAAAAAGI